MIYDIRWERWDEIWDMSMKYDMIWYDMMWYDIKIWFDIMIWYDHWVSIFQCWNIDTQRYDCDWRLSWYDVMIVIWYDHNDDDYYGYIINITIDDIWDEATDSQGTSQTVFWLDSVLITFVFVLVFSILNYHG